jgi:hypothetical protein
VCVTTSVVQISITLLNLKKQQHLPTTLSDRSESDILYFAPGIRINAGIICLAHYVNSAPPPRIHPVTWALIKYRQIGEKLFGQMFISINERWAKSSHFRELLAGNRF